MHRLLDASRCSAENDEAAVTPNADTGTQNPDQPKEQSKEQAKEQGPEQTQGTDQGMAPYGRGEYGSAGGLAYGFGGMPHLGAGIPPLGAGGFRGGGLAQQQLQQGYGGYGYAQLAGMNMVSGDLDAVVRSEVTRRLMVDLDAR